MRIINVLEIVNGTPQQIVSFPVYEEQLSEEVAQEAEDLFVACIKDNAEDWSEEIIENAIGDAVFTDLNGYEVYIMWSDID